MFEKQILGQLLGRLLRYGRLEVTYWDDEVRQYAGSEGHDEPELQVTVTDPSVVRRIIANASLAVGESYMDGRLQVDENQLPLLFKLVAKNRPMGGFRQLSRRHRNREKRQRGYIARHYDVGNEYYDLFLDPTRLYSCAYFETESDTLEKAQRQKISMLLRKLQLGQGMRLLDIGCGWGHLAVTAAKQYGVSVLGITLSAEQLKGARELAEREGVSHLVQFELKNYQALKDLQFDRIISVGMFEHVGKGNGDQYFSKVAELLVDGGVSVLHTITQQTPQPTDAWVDKYVFPGGHLPTVAEIEASLASHGFWSIDRENLWEHYARTLQLWREKHRASHERIIGMFGKVFYRMRDFWLAGSEAGFRFGQLGLTQIVFTKGKPRPNMWPRTRAYLYEKSFS